MQDDLVERVADMLTDWGCGASTDCTSMARAIIPMVLEEAAKVVEGFIDGGGGPGDGVAELAAERIRAIGAP